MLQWTVAHRTCVTKQAGGFQAAQLPPPTTLDGHPPCTRNGLTAQCAAHRHIGLRLPGPLPQSSPCPGPIGIGIFVQPDRRARFPTKQMKLAKRSPIRRVLIGRGTGAQPRLTLHAHGANRVPGDDVQSHAVGRRCLQWQRRPWTVKTTRSCYRAPTTIRTVCAAAAAGAKTADTTLQRGVTDKDSTREDAGTAGIHR